MKCSHYDAHRNYYNNIAHCSEHFGAQLLGLCRVEYATRTAFRCNYVVRARFCVRLRHFGVHGTDGRGG